MCSLKAHNIILIMLYELRDKVINLRLNITLSYSLRMILYIRQYTPGTLVLIFKYYLFNVGKSHVLYPFYVLA